MTEARYFEKSSGGVVRHWRIEQDGIRCRIAWGQVGGQTRGLSMTLDDEADAERHFKKKVSEKKRQGYVEVAPDAAEASEAAADAIADAKLLDVDSYWMDYEPVEGYGGVFAKCYDVRASLGPFYGYLVLSEDERRGLHFTIKKPGHDSSNVSAFLDFIRPRLELAFDGRSHHKVPLPSPIGQFDHVLFCGPSLCRNRSGGRLGKCFPILDCEICDEDTEALVEARIDGRDSMPSTTWDREPSPVIDLRFDLRSESGFVELDGDPSVREKTFKVYRRSMLDRGLRLLLKAQADSWLEIRNYRRDVLTLTQADLTRVTYAELDRFLLGDSALA